MIYSLLIFLSIGLTNGDKPAAVTDVKVSGSENNYNFSVTIKSPDKGCNQYADWWEVISVDGETLHYRRILAHSHVKEQPFDRSGGPVEIDPGEVVIVRAHMNNSGYSIGIVAMIGTIENGFKPIELEKGFGEDLEKLKPLPSGCAF